MTSHAAPQSTRQRSPARLWGLVLAVGFAWVVRYAFNGRLWDWVVYDLVDVDPQNRLGRRNRRPDHRLYLT